MFTLGLSVPHVYQPHKFWAVEIVGDVKAECRGGRRCSASRWAARSLQRLLTRLPDAKTLVCTLRHRASARHDQAEPIGCAGGAPGETLDCRKGYWSAWIHHLAGFPLSELIPSGACCYLLYGAGSRRKQVMLIAQTAEKNNKALLARDREQDFSFAAPLPRKLRSWPSE
jgi:hypothetical protein